MNICKYCKEKGMTKEEYFNFTNNIKEVAKVIRSQLKYNGGMYYPTDNILKNWSNSDMKYFIINELKNLDIEFIKDDEYYRVV